MIKKMDDEFWDIFVVFLSLVIYGLGLIVPLTPPEGIPSLLELIFFLILPLVLLISRLFKSPSKINKAFFIIIIVSIFIFSMRLLYLQASSALIDSADFQLNNSTKIVVSIKPSHLFLAEYRRWVSLEENNNSLDKEEIFPDTGGYLRTNLYRISDSFFILDYGVGQTSIDLINETVNYLTNPTELKLLDENTIFIGSFDFDNFDRFRFISKEERPELRYNFDYMDL